MMMMMTIVPFLIDSKLTKLHTEFQNFLEDDTLKTFSLNYE